MTGTLSKPLTTPSELLAMPDSIDYELVDGELVVRNMNVLSSFVEGNVLGKLVGFCQKYRVGLVWPGSVGYQCFPGHPNKVRKPDVSFVNADRFAANLFSSDYLPIAPDLVVEVTSPNDLEHEINEKIEEYFQAGVSLIWIVDPESRLVQVYRPDGSGCRLRENDELQGESVLPGFRCKVAELFPTRAPSSAG